jgi:hypothetical protein
MPPALGLPLAPALVLVTPPVALVTPPVALVAPPVALVAPPLALVAPPLVLVVPAVALAAPPVVLIAPPADEPAAPTPPFAGAPLQPARITPREPKPKPKSSAARQLVIRGEWPTFVPSVRFRDVSSDRRRFQAGQRSGAVTAHRFRHVLELGIGTVLCVRHVGPSRAQPRPRSRPRSLSTTRSPSPHRSRTTCSSSCAQRAACTRGRCSRVGRASTQELAA